jgi:hypothetical protein
MRIRIRWETGQIEGELAPGATAEAVYAALPCSSEANTWGDEVYFSIDVSASLEPGARQVVDPGTICYWIEGRSMALPFGPTPISQGGECRLAAVVNVIGRLDGDPTALGAVRDGDRIRVEAA